MKNNSKDDNSISTSANNENNVSKDSITAYVGNNIFESSLDPIKGAMSYGYSFTNNALTRVNPNSEYEGDLAESWSISEDSLTYTFNLKKGQEIDPNNLKSILDNEMYIKAKNKALSILSKASQSEKQIRQKLSSDYEEDTIDMVIEFLQKYKFVDDEDLASRIVNTNVNLNKYGKIK